ncbi:MAG: hypothetical protein JSR89_04785 [Proteobacteria bacterium]|nr:hypothetical protein [Pseudomonadota bacterium]
MSPEANSFGVLRLLMATFVLISHSKALGALRATCNKVDASFGIYIFAGPTQQTLLWLMPGVQPVWLSLVASAIVLPVAIVSWIAIEKPALQLNSLITGCAKLRQPSCPLPAT